MSKPTQNEETIKNENEAFVIEAALNLGFNILNDDATFFSCSETQLIALVRPYLQKIENLKNELKENLK